MTALKDLIGSLSGNVDRHPPVAKLIGFALTAVGDGTATFTMRADSRHHNPMATLHGGILCDIADAAMGMAFASTLEENESFTTLELKINYLRPVKEADLTAVGRVVSRGSTVGLVECDIRDAGGRLVARASSTCTVLRGSNAHGRKVGEGLSSI